MQRVNMFEIKEAQEQDLEAVIELLFDDPIGKTREKTKKNLSSYKKAFQAILKDPNNFQLIGVEEDKIVATFQVTLIPSLTFEGRTRCMVEGVRVDKTHRGKKVGSQIFDWIKAFAKEHQCVMIQLTTNKLRNEALTFYAKQGFMNTHHGLKLML